MGNPAAPALHGVADRNTAATGICRGSLHWRRFSDRDDCVGIGVDDSRSSCLADVALQASGGGRNCTRFGLCHFQRVAERFRARDLVILSIDASPLTCWLESRFIAVAPMEHCSDRVLRHDAAFHTTAMHIWPALVWPRFDGHSVCNAVAGMEDYLVSLG